MNRYHQGIRLETPICKVFQSYIEEQRDYKSFLTLRPDQQASIDFLGRLYDKETNKTIVQLAVEVRTLSCTKEQIDVQGGYICFPVCKLNELMKFWRMGKECYIVYSLVGEIYFLSWDYYLKHNFSIGKNRRGKYVLNLPMRNFKYCGELKKDRN